MAKKSVSKTTAKKTVKTDDQLEKIQDANLTDFKKEVEKIDSVEDIEKLKEIEKRDDDRKGAAEILEQRKAELAGDEQPEQQKTKEELIAEGAIGEAPNNDIDPSEEDRAKEKSDFVAEIKSYRKDLDKILQMSKAHMGVDDTPERDLFLAKAWLGKLLAAFDAKNPYAGENKIKGRNEIPATAERFEEVNFQGELTKFNLLVTYEAAIKLRADLEKVIDWIDSIDLHYFDLGYNNRNARICRTQAYVAAQQAKFHFGVILGAQKV